MQLNYDETNLFARIHVVDDTPLVNSGDNPNVVFKSGDVEVLLSGRKTQGLQVVSRNWLYSGGHSQTTMTDDIPTEAWLYP